MKVRPTNQLEIRRHVFSRVAAYWYCMPPFDSKPGTNLDQCCRVPDERMRKITVYSGLYGIVLAAACGLSRAVTEGGIGSALQPYVNRHELAGAVALIASKDKVL